MMYAARRVSHSSRLLTGMSHLSCIGKSFYRRTAFRTWIQGNYTTNIVKQGDTLNLAILDHIDASISVSSAWQDFCCVEHSEFPISIEEIETEFGHELRITAPKDGQDRHRMNENDQVQIDVVIPEYFNVNVMASTANLVMKGKVEL